MKCYNINRIGVKNMSNRERFDPRIKDLVAELQRLGIETFSSCEGHVDEGSKYPWIDIVSKHAEEILRIVAWYNTQVYRNETESEVLWTILPRATMKLQPEKNGFSLEELQQSAVEFAKKLQGLKKIPKLPGT